MYMTLLSPRTST